jgi:hypothetical protein
MASQRWRVQKPIMQAVWFQLVTSIIGHKGICKRHACGVVRLDIPDGMNAEETRRFLRDHGADICGPRRDRQRTLARRLEDLEAELLPVAGETITIGVDFVERDGTVTDHMDFTINTPAQQPRRIRPWRRK